MFNSFSNYIQEYSGCLQYIWTFEKNGGGPNNTLWTSGFALNCRQLNFFVSNAQGRVWGHMYFTESPYYSLQHASVKHPDQCPGNKLQQVSGCRKKLALNCAPCLATQTDDCQMSWRCIKGLTLIKLTRVVLPFRSWSLWISPSDNVKVK